MALFKKKKKAVVSKAKQLSEELKEETTETTNEPVKKRGRRNIRLELEQLMDFKRPFSMLYSGVESERFFNMCYSMGIRNFLVSFEYVKKISHIINAECKVFVDSGAFTYNQDDKYKSFTIEQWERHIDKYLTWAREHADHIFAIANLDLEYLVGADIVQEWNRKYFEPFMAETGIPVCFIWHGEATKLTWEQYCKRYPYVGISAVTDNLQSAESFLAEKLKVAERYGTVVHGMGMTRTAILPRLPFYTVDSTTWLAGVKYGEYSVWNGQIVARYKKHQFDEEVVPRVKTFKEYDFDIEKLREVDFDETIKLSLYSFRRGEKYIQERLKKRMYWQKPKAVMQRIDEVEKETFPSVEFVENILSENIGEVKDYAVNYNVNPDIPQDELRYIIKTMTVFLSWHLPEWEDLKAEYLANNCMAIHALHEQFIGTITSSEEEEIEDLQLFFTNCFEGRDTRLLHYGTNFDRETKERDHYLEEEDEFEFVDLPDDVVKEKIAGLLPSPSDADEEVPTDLIALENEIFEETGVKPTFDKKGRFVKGQVAVRKPKQIYSEKFPKLSCDVCFNSATCPEYKAGHVCAYSKIFKKFDTRNMGDLVTGMQSIVDYNMERMQFAMISEKLNGGLEDKVDKLMDTNIRYMGLLKSMYEASNSEVVKQTRVVHANGTVENTLEHKNPQQGSILEKLFMGDLNKKEEPKEEVVTVEVVDNKEEDKQKN